MPPTASNSCSAGAHRQGRRASRWTGWTVSRVSSLPDSSLAVAPCTWATASTRSRPTGSGVRLTFGRTTVDAARVVIAVPVPALRAIVGGSPAMQTPIYERILDSVEPFPAMKLYLWYERPWWRPTIRGIRSTTDMPIRKVWYVDTASDAPSALLAMYTDGRHVEPWRETWDGAAAGSPASAPDARGRAGAAARPAPDGLRDPGAGRFCADVLGRRPARDGLAVLATGRHLGRDHGPGHPACIRRSRCTSRENRSPDRSPGSKVRWRLPRWWLIACPRGRRRGRRVPPPQERRIWSCAISRARLKPTARRNTAFIDTTNRVIARWHGTATDLA